MKKIVVVTIVFLSVFASCKKKEECIEVEVPTEQLIEVHLKPMLNDVDYTMEDIIISANGYRYFFNRIQFIGMNVKNANGDLYREDFMYDTKKIGTQCFYGKGDPKDFTAMNVQIGVGKNINNTDPSLQPTTSALNIINSNDMHWGWNPGYIFLKLEGRADFSDDGIDNFDDLITFHLGASGLLRNVELNNLKWTNVNATTNRLDLKLNMKNIFDEPELEHDLKADPSSNSLSSQATISNKIMDQFVKAIYQ
jgi:hypothetical protein